jgi:hypothetical protein
MTPVSISRRTFMAGTVATLVACGTTDDRRRAQDAPAGSSTPRRRGRLSQKGVNYDVGTSYFPGELSLVDWRPEFVRRELEAIRTDLHGNSILLLGSDFDRLIEAAVMAADAGLYVWLEPRAPEANPQDTLAFLTSVGRAAEDLRAVHRDVGLALGCELTMFMSGLVPGDDWLSRGAALGQPASAGYNDRLNQFFAGGLPEIRRSFGGQLTYSSGVWEEVDWSGFDVVGVNLYRDADNEATYLDDVRALHRHGKPVVLTEFGCCAYRGADDRGGMGWDVIDFDADPPVVVGGLVRDEQVQADYIDELLDIFEAERVHGAFVYDFISPDSPYSPDPHFDFDMASFSIVKVHPSGSDRAYDTSGAWDPKLAFDIVAERFAR